MVAILPEAQPFLKYDTNFTKNTADLKNIFVKLLKNNSAKRKYILDKFSSMAWKDLNQRERQQHFDSPCEACATFHAVDLELLQKPLKKKKIKLLKL